jgi:hypothetical protein
MEWLWERIYRFFISLVCPKVKSTQHAYNSAEVDSEEIVAAEFQRAFAS